MTVQELKNHLSQYPDDMEVCLMVVNGGEQYFFSVERSEETKVRKMNGSNFASKLSKNGKPVIVLR